MLKRLALFAVFVLVATPAPAQPRIDYVQRAQDLETLSQAFGVMHHIRRMCEPRREAEVWRNRMRKLVELEQPQPALRDRMVEAFNTGFRDATARFEFCEEDARDYAAATAAQADTVVNRLMEPLYGALSETGELPQVWRGGDNN
ncbi:MAG: TIGR02301 family protein [Parvularculaceae bacterium]